VIANKQHTSWLAIKQAADVGKPFKLVKSMLPSYSVQHIPADRCPMKALMIHAFKEQLNNDLNLTANKMKSLIDFTSTLLEMAMKACSVKNIQHGFIMTGQIDGTNMRFPVFDTILSMCRRNPKKEEYENIEKNMTNILYHPSDYGHISEDVYDQMVIVRDPDSMVCEVLHEATISQESYQRTKCLTHEDQIHLWKERLAQNQSIERQRKELATQKHLDKITQDDDIVRSLCKKLEVGGLLTDDEVGTVHEE
jgi:hypothetical protein